jgi:dienelactone hydrolase
MLARIIVVICWISFLGIAPAHADLKERPVSIPTKGPAPLAGRFYAPSSKESVPGILLLHTAGGVSEADHNFARKLAGAGFAALVVSYRVGWAAPGNLGLAAAVDWLRNQPESRNMPVGVVGFSLGASKALLVAALRPATVKAVVSYYGTYNVKISRFGEAVRTAQRRTGLEMTSPVEVASKIIGAILLLQGSDDEETSPEQTRQMTDVLARAKKTYELKVFPGAVHLFERDDRYQPAGHKTPFGTVTG